MSSSVIGALRANLGLDSARFSTGAKQARSQLGDLKKAFAVAAAAAAAGAAAIVAFATRSAAAIDRTAKSARRVEESVAGFRAMELATGELGVEVSTLTDGVQTMNRELANGSKGAISALAQLGIDAAEFKRQRPVEQLASLSDAIEKTGMTSSQASVLLQKLGVRNKEMVLALTSGGQVFRKAQKDIADYGLALSDIDASKIEEANDRIGRLGLIGKYFGDQIALSVVPALGRMAKAMTDSLREGGALRAVLDAIAGAVDLAVRSIGVLAENMDILAIGAIGLAGTALPSLVAALTAKTAGMTAASLATGVLSAALRGLRVALMLVGGPWGLLAGLITAAAGAMLIFGRNTDTMTASANDAQKAAETLGTELGILSGKDLPAATARTVDLANANLTLARSAYAAAEAEVAKAKAAADSLWTQTSMESAFLPGVEPPSSAGYRESMERLHKTVDELKKAEAELNQRVMEGNQVKLEASDVIRTVEVRATGLGDALDRAGGAGKRAGKDIADGMKEAAEASERGANALEGIFGAALDGADSARNAVANLLKEIAKVQFSKGMMMLLGQTSWGSSLISGIGSLIGANAAGTSYWQGGLSAINERGGEIVDLPRGSRVIPHDISKRMADQAASGARERVLRVEIDKSPYFDAVVREISDQSSASMGAQINQALPARVQQITSRPRVR